MGTWAILSEISCIHIGISVYKHFSIFKRKFKSLLVKFENERYWLISPIRKNIKLIRFKGINFNVEFKKK